MNDGPYWKLNFRVVLDTPASLAVRDGVPVEFGSSLLGGIRHSFRSLTKFSDPGRGGTVRQPDSARIRVREIRFEDVPDVRSRVKIDRFTVSAISDSLTHDVTVPSGAMIVGAVWVDSFVSAPPTHVAQECHLELGTHRNRQRGPFGVRSLPR